MFSARKMGQPSPGGSLLVRLVQGLVQQRRVFFPQLLGPVADQQDQVRLVQGLAAAGHPQLLDGIVAVPQAGGVHQTEEVSL